MRPGPSGGAFRVSWQPQGRPGQNGRQEVATLAARSAANGVQGGGGWEPKLLKRHHSDDKIQLRVHKTCHHYGVFRTPDLRSIPTPKRNAWFWQINNKSFYKKVLKT